MFMLIGMRLSAQVGINADGTPPDNSAILDAKSANKGFLPPRVALTAINSAQPVTSPAIGLFVYNTAASGTPPNNVLPGYYCWIGTKWTPLLPAQGANNGDMLYWNGTTWVLVPAGVHGQPMYFCNGIPTWGGCTPILTTTAISNLTASSVTSGGNVISECGAAVTERGLCYSTSPNPTIANNHIENGYGLGLFTLNLIELMPGTQFYIRAYATNSNGTGYGNEITFSTFAALGNCGSLAISHTIGGGVAPVTIQITYNTITNLVGEPSKCWISQNLGAQYQPYGVTECWEVMNGWYWKFNRKQGYNYDGTTVTPSWTTTSINENSDWLLVNDPCKIELGTTWRIPTKTEWANVDAAGNWSNWYGPFYSGLKLNAAGKMSGTDGTMISCGYYGYYWSGNQGSTYSGQFLNISSYSSYVDLTAKADGLSVRCIKDVASAFTIGQSYQGGIIFYIDGTGQHGLIAAATNQSTGIQWYNGSFTVTGATGTSIGTGNSNTNTIVASQGAGSYAAKLCYDLVLNGYSDWYLPSKAELDQLYLNRNAVGGFSTLTYWSSSEYSSSNAASQYFNFGGQLNDYKGFTNYVRAIRSF